MNLSALLWVPGGTEIFVILLIVVLLFGAKKIPELMKGVGKGIKEFKDASAKEENPSGFDNQGNLGENDKKDTGNSEQPN